MSKKQIKKIVIINAIVVWFVFTVIIAYFGGDFSSIPAAFFWGGVGYWLMKKKLLPEEEGGDLKEDPNRVYECKKCGYRNHDYFENCPQCGNNTKQYAYINAEEKQTTSSEITHICLSPEDETPKHYGSYNVSGADISLKNDIATATTAIKKNPAVTQNNKVMYCRKCGSKLTEDSHFCCKCGTKIISEDN